MMDHTALAKSSAKCWTKLGKGLMSEAEELYSECWATDGEDVADHLFEAAYAAHDEAEYVDQRLWRVGLVF